MTSLLLCLLLSPGLLSTPASSKLGLSSCFRNNVAYDLGQAIASKAVGDVTSCQQWCQVRPGQLNRVLFLSLMYFRLRLS